MIFLIFILNFNLKKLLETKFLTHLNKFIFIILTK